MKKILIINGNPVMDSFGAALSEAYKKGAIYYDIRYAKVVRCSIYEKPCA